MDGLKKLDFRTGVHFVFCSLAGWRSTSRCRCSTFATGFGRASLRSIRGLLLLCHPNKVTCLLRGHAVPDAVASCNDEIELWVDLVRADVWIGAHCHLLWLEGGRLVFPVTNGATDSDNAVYSSILNHMSCLQDSCTLSG